MEQVPDSPPRMDVMVDEAFDGSGVQVVFYNHDTGLHTIRQYETMADARKMAAFIALTLGISKGDQLNRWLSERKFDPFSEDHTRTAEQIQAQMKSDAAIKAIEESGGSEVVEEVEESEGSQADH